MSGPHFRDYHLLLDEHAEQIFAMTDDIAERARKIGGTTLHSISDVSRHQRLQDNNEEFVTPNEMLTELADFEPKGAVARAYGIYDEKEGMCERALFVINADGIISLALSFPDGCQSRSKRNLLCARRS